MKSFIFNVMIAAIGFVTAPAFARDISHKDIKIIGHQASVNRVEVVQIGAAPPEAGAFNPTAIELKISADSYCFGVAIEPSQGRLSVVDTLPSGGFASAGCSYDIQYFWAPMSDLGTPIGSVTPVTLEIGPFQHWSSGVATESWFNVTADVKHLYGTFGGGMGHYYEYSNVQISQAP